MNYVMTSLMPQNRGNVFHFWCFHDLGTSVYVNGYPVSYIYKVTGTDYTIWTIVLAHVKRLDHNISGEVLTDLIEMLCLRYRMFRNSMS